MTLNAIGASKKIFGTEDNKENLVNFLNAFFDEVAMPKITDVTFANKERQGRTKNDKTILLDVICKTDRGETFIVEMQRYKQSDLVDRILYYLEMSTDDIPKGYRIVKSERHSFDLIPTHIIAILDFNYWPFEEAVNSFYWMNKKRNFRMTDKRSIHYLELKKFPQQPVELSNLLEKWVYLLNNLEDMTSRPEVLDDKEFDLVLASAEYANLSKEDRQIYKQEIMNELDYQGALDYAKKEGLEQGREEGLKKGLEEGLEEGKARGAEEQMVVSLRSMISKNFSDDDIMAILGIDKEKLGDLKKIL